MVRTWQTHCIMYHLRLMNVPSLLFVSSLAVISHHPHIPHWPLVLRSLRSGQPVGTALAVSLPLPDPLFIGSKHKTERLQGNDKSLISFSLFNFPKMFSLERYWTKICQGSFFVLVLSRQLLHPGPTSLMQEGKAHSSSHLEPWPLFLHGSTLIPNPSAFPLFLSLGDLCLPHQNHQRKDHLPKLFCLQR